MKIHRLILPVVFPAGLSPGEAKTTNLLTVARDGKGRPVLRGTALAGAMRQAWRERIDDNGKDTTDLLFGASVGDNDTIDRPSSLEVADVLLCTDKDSISFKPHNQINRHNGTVLKGNLFSLEALPPGTKATLVLWCREHTEGLLAGRGEAAMKSIAAIFQQGLILGGRSNRGVGLARLCAACAATLLTYDLGDIDQHAQYLDDHHAWRQSNTEKLSIGHEVTGEGNQSTSLAIEITWRIPRGQDLLVADGAGQEQQTVIDVNGDQHWRLPGSSLRGVMRSWINRLAAREGKPVAFDVNEHMTAIEENREITGEDVGYAFLSKAEREQPEAYKLIKCPVSKLFGTMLQRGRIHIADALSPVKEHLKQVRMHVAIDRITGGAKDGALFKNEVIIGSQVESPRFTSIILVNDPTEDEVRWICKTIKAIDLGVVRIGTRKAAGRLELAEPIKATGRFAEQFNTLATKQPA